MNTIGNIKENREIYGKKFEENGNIEEGELSEYEKLIKGLRWKLKYDGTYDKYRVERKVSKEDGKLGDKIETFICNEEHEWKLVNSSLLIFKIIL